MNESGPGEPARLVKGEPCWKGGARATTSRLASTSKAMLIRISTRPNPNAMNATPKATTDVNNDARERGGHHRVAGIVPIELGVRQAIASFERVAR